MSTFLLFVVTHAMKSPIRMTIPQMQEAAREGAFIEFDYGGLLGTKPELRIEDYVKAIRQIGPASAILSSARATAVSTSCSSRCTAMRSA